MNKPPEPRRAAAHSSPRCRALIETADGCFPAEFSARGLARLSFPSGPGDKGPKPAIAGESSAPPPPAWLKQTRAAVAALLAGRAPRVFPPLDLSCGTPFQQLVWQALREIPVGETRSYGEIARAIGRPRGVAEGRCRGFAPARWRSGPRTATCAPVLRGTVVHGSYAHSRDVRSARSPSRPSDRRAAGR